MNISLEDLNEGRVFEEFEYRLLYFRPTPYSDERIAIGLVATSHEGLQARFISSAAAIDLMIHTFGENAVEQFQFAAGEVRRALSAFETVDRFVMPTDLLVLGEKSAAVTHDRDGLLKSVLTSASCLMRVGASKNADPLSPPVQVQLQKDLFEHVNRLNPFIGKRIFNQKFTAKSGEVVTLPILGNRIFGAPVSFATKDQSMKAEAYVAKFHWLRGQMSQKPVIYLLAPQDALSEKAARLDPSIRELRAIAAASRVPLKISESTERMASEILKDEAA